MISTVLLVILLLLAVIIISGNITIDLTDFSLPDLTPVKDPQITEIQKTRLGKVYTIYNPNRDKMDIEMVSFCDGKEFRQTAILLGKAELRYSISLGCEDLLVRKL